MDRLDYMIEFAQGVAADDSHGYSQLSRTGNPDYDCSSLVIAAANAAGYDTGLASYTGNMRSELITKGWICSPLINLRMRGDILLNEQYHTAIYLGDGKLVEASSSETGTISGVAGDQTGREIAVNSYYDYPWTFILRPPDDVKPVGLWEKHNQANQFFTLSESRLVTSVGYYLDIERGTRHGAKLISYYKKTGSNQLFSIDVIQKLTETRDLVYIRCKDGGLVLQATDTSDIVASVHGDWESAMWIAEKREGKISFMNLEYGLMLDEYMSW